ncbi:MAG: MliC family protein [Pseudomonadota bacterium]|nr:MliC family protein [Pseudomonadota bacterium]
MRRVAGSRLAAAALALAGCVALAPAARSAPAAPAIVYACPDGQSVRAIYPDTRTAVIEYRGATHMLKIVASADGARYLGEGLQWWTKGMTHGTIAALAPGETYAPPGEDCIAPPTSPGSAP